MPAPSPPVAALPSRPPVVTVSGFCSGVGKTSLVEFLIRRLRPIAALKVTVVDSGIAGCPIDRACGVCEALEAPYRVITERRRIEVPRKDTGRYAAAGAHPVVWVQTHKDCLDEALAAGFAAASGPGGVVVEGNTPVSRLHPDVCIMVDRPGRRETKPSAAAILDRIQVAVLNCPAGEEEGVVSAARAKLRGDLPATAGVFELDLRAPGGAGERLMIHLSVMLQLRDARVEGWKGRNPC
jgi:molybdopterin-guanine dinucleotide biosynthesis protein